MSSQIEQPTALPPVSRVARQIRDTALLSLYQTWKAARTGPALPTLEALNLSQDSTLQQVFVAEVVDLAPFTLRTSYLGFALSAQLGRALNGTDVISSDNEDVLGALEATYRRCVRLREPSYESMRFKLEDGGKPTSFERLLLPCASADGSQHFLVGMVVFENLALSS